MLTCYQSRVAAVEKAEAEKVQVVKAAEADAEVSFQTSHHPKGTADMIKPISELPACRSEAACSLCHNSNANGNLEQFLALTPPYA